MKKLNKAFTLVELIITVVILIILWTIWYISIESYWKQARDSARISDIWKIKRAIELFQIDAGKYPLPTNYSDITYSWAVVWKQWTFWEDSKIKVKTLDKAPRDPLSESEYTYSVTEKRNEFEVAWAMETEEFALNKREEVYAWDKLAVAYVSWNYNGLMNKTFSWSDCYVLNLPTIISSDIETSNQVDEIIKEKRLVFNWYRNLPSSYKWSKFNINGWFNFVPNKLLSYKWNCEVLDKSLWEKIKLIINTQVWYSWTLLDPRENPWN